MEIQLYFLLEKPSANSLPATLTLPTNSGTPSPATVTLAQNPALNNIPIGNALGYDTGTLTPAIKIDGSQQTLSLAVKATDVASALGSTNDPAAQVEDIVLIITYIY